MGTSTGTYTVTGGTGAFANATGSGTYEALRDVCTATGTHYVYGNDLQAELELRVESQVQDLFRS